LGNLKHQKSANGKLKSTQQRERRTLGTEPLGSGDNIARSNTASKQNKHTAHKSNNRATLQAKRVRQSKNSIIANITSNRTKELARDRHSNIASNTGTHPPKEKSIVISVARAAQRAAEQR
jgi:hypothetical protein